jgi:threonine dehydrogenase-like Zn-dependent dehydrogenase
VSGAGVAGLAAIGTANSLGAIVRATDVRPEVAEQVESMGAEFVKPDVAEGEVSTDGYAKEMGADYAAAAAVMYAEQAKDCRHHRHHRPHPRQAGPAADHRGDGRLDEAGLGHRRHGRVQRRQRRRLGGRPRWSSPTTA